MIRMEGITKDYIVQKQVTHALRGIDLTVEKGEMVAVMGPSGSGKSTLLNILGGMDSATSGTYIFNGENVRGFSPKELHKFRRENISFVFQSFALMEKYSVYENVEMPLIARNVKKRKEIVMECLKKMGIEDQAKKCPPRLSGGQQQRCAIARALAAGTPVLLADEPTGALDKKTGGEIIDCLREFNSEGKTVFVITHDPDVAAKCGRIILLEDGLIKTADTENSDKRYV